MYREAIIKSFSIHFWLINQVILFDIFKPKTLEVTILKIIEVNFSIRQNSLSVVLQKPNS